MWTLILSTIVINKAYYPNTTLEYSNYAQSDVSVSGFTSAGECYKAGDILKQGFQSGNMTKVAFCVEVK